MITWWRDAVVYQIYPRSFCDSNDDGVGDLGGVRRQLAYLAWLGVDALWLSPIFLSPMRDFGYDVADYVSVDPIFGTLEDFDALVREAHELGIRVVLDWVPNHTSSDHPWFVASRSSLDSAKRDWYIWRDAGPGGSPPNNWVGAWSDEPTWTWDETTRQYYLHCFLPGQPDLNWANVDVREAMYQTLRFWLDRGVDGFRIDVVNLLGKDVSANDPEELRALSHTPLNDARRPTTTCERSEASSTGTRGIECRSARSVSSTQKGWQRTTATMTSFISRSTSRHSSRRGSQTRGLTSLRGPRGSCPL